jgi:flagellin
MLNGIMEEGIVMIINHNMTAQNSYNSLTRTNTAVTKSTEKLSSGLRINRAGDDAAGLAISEKMRGQINGLNQASRNAQDGISMIQTAEGALNETHAILQRMRELSVQSANDTNQDEDRAQIQLEVADLISEIDRISTDTQFNGADLLAGAVTKTFHLGANEGQKIDVAFQGMSATDLSVNGLTVGTQADADGAITTIDDAIKSVSDFRSELGAKQNRLEHTINNLRTSSENLQAAESRIRDVDVASEMVSYSKNQILVQSGTSMLAQANTAPNSVLELLG